jgi:hypothetical protein
MRLERLVPIRAASSRNSNRKWGHYSRVCSLRASREVPRNRAGCQRCSLRMPMCLSCRHLIPRQRSSHTVRSLRWALQATTLSLLRLKRAVTVQFGLARTTQLFSCQGIAARDLRGCAGTNLRTRETRGLTIARRGLSRRSLTIEEPSTESALGCVRALSVTTTTYRTDARSLGASCAATVKRARA